MDDHLKTVLKAIIDPSSLSDAKKQLANERLQIPVEIQVTDLSKNTSELEKQLSSIGELLKSLDASPLSQSIQAILDMKDAITACGEAWAELVKYSQSSNSLVEYFDDASESVERYNSRVQAASKSPNIKSSALTSKIPTITLQNNDFSSAFSELSSIGQSYEETVGTIQTATTDLESCLNSFETSFQGLSESFQNLIDSSFGSASTDKFMSFEKIATTVRDSASRTLGTNAINAAASGASGIFKNLDFPVRTVKGYLKVA